MKLSSVTLVGLCLVATFWVWPALGQVARDTKAPGQEWKAILPFDSNCSDVKRVFSLSKCDFPVTRIQLPSMKIVVRFSTRDDEWPVSDDTVVNMIVIFRDLPKLFDFEREFYNYTIKHEPDAPEILVYRNDRKGIRLEVQTGDGLNIGSFERYPSEENIRKLRALRLRKVK